MRSPPCTIFHKKFAASISYSMHTSPFTVLLQLRGLTRNKKFASPPTCERAVARAMKLGLYK